MPVPLARALGKSLGTALVARWLQERGSEDTEAFTDSIADDSDSDRPSSESSL